MSILKKEAKLEVREVVFCKEEENSFCDIFIYEPENVEEQKLGNLYIVGEIVNFSDSSSYLVNLLASIIKKEFYSKPKRPTMESLEAGLHKANATLSGLAEQGNVDWIGNLNMICGAYKKNELYFSQVGGVKTLLVRDGQITDIGKNIVKEEKPHPFKTFANIASGEIEKNDLILLSTPEFFNIFSLEKIRQLSSSLDINELTETVYDAIEQEENITTVGLLVMKISNEKQDERKEEKFKKKKFEVEEELEAEKTEDSESSEDSESKKVIKEKLTITNNIERITLDDIIDKYEKAEIEKQTTEQKFEQKLKSTTEKQEEAVKEFEEIEKEKSISIVNKSRGLIKILKELFDSLKNSAMARLENYKQKKKDSSESADSTDQKTENELLQKINLPSSKNKIILAAFMFIILLFAGNLIFTDYQKKAEEKFSFYNNKLSQAEEKISKAEEVMIYNDPKEARIFLADAKNLATEVRDGYDKLDEKADSLLGKIQTQLDVVNLVKRIASPEIAVNLEQASEQLMLINENYYASASENSVYQIDLENKKAEDLQVESDNIEHSKLTTPIEKTGEIIFLSDSNKLSSLDLDKKEIAPVDIKLINDNPNIKALASYNNYLYFLEPEANQIYKYQRTANGFAGGKLWITDSEANIQNAISLAIDGFIYVLKSDGTIDKYLSGVKKDFAIENLSEPISSSAKIYTNADLEYLYVIDPPQQRIVLFNKVNGSLIGQYLSDSFADLKNIVVSEIEDKMYVLSGDKVFVVGIEGEE